VKPLGRVPKFYSQRCRQRAAEKRKWLRPAPLVALSDEIGTARVRAAIREEGLDPAVVSPGAISMPGDRKWLSQNISR